MQGCVKKQTLLSYFETTLPPGVAIDLVLLQGFAFASDHPLNEKKERMITINNKILNV